MQDDIQKYIRCMDEIKLRDAVIDNFLNGSRTTGKLMIDIELICLQFRKICELIMLSALCIHKTEFQRIHKKIEKEWDPIKINKTLENIHHEFYPNPFERIVDSDTGRQKNIRITKEFLTRSECISLIGRCGGLLHGFNPLNDDKVYKEVEKIRSKFPEWKKRIGRLLKTHEIKLSGTSKQLWVYMAYGEENKVFVEERVPT